MPFLNLKMGGQSRLILPTPRQPPPVISNVGGHYAHLLNSLVTASATKMSAATVADPSGATVRVVKGAFAAIMSLTESSPGTSTIANQLEAQGFRVLAVAVGSPEAVKLAGIIALSDPPRTDSASLITELHTLGVRTVMVTGDAPATAAIVARAVGLDGAPKFRLSLGIETLRTLAFVVIVFGNQATTYTNRERRRIGSARPSLWLIGSSVFDLLIASVLATCGIAMAPLPIFLVGGTLITAAVFAVVLDFAKVPVFNRLNIA
jgi:hypothetical protein